MPMESEFLSNPFSILFIIIIIFGVILLGSGVIRFPRLGFEAWLAIIIVLVTSSSFLLWKYKMAEDSRKKSRTLFDLKYGASGFSKLDPQLTQKLEDQLEELKEELDGGVITQEEYDEKRKKLMDQYTNK